ncbi:MAG TPA: transposase [Candidatus Angelobacter sp.]|jgi:REP element-mobilizing transposase RayT|nr:transposase [Candidatus Angelobacter sp.]
MSHSYLCCLLHIVFTTAERRPLVRDEMRDRLHAYLNGIARENGMPALAVGGVPDHIRYVALPGTNYVTSGSCSIAKSRIFEMGKRKLSGNILGQSLSGIF